MTGAAAGGGVTGFRAGAGLSAPFGAGPAGAAAGAGNGAPGGRVLRNRAANRLFAIGEPDVVNRVLDCMQTRARCKHPAGENTFDLALQRNFVNLDKRIGVGRFGRRPRIAGSRGDLQRAELDGLADRGVERNGAAGDLVEAGKYRAGVLDLLRRRLGDDRIIRLR